MQKGEKVLVRVPNDKGMYRVFEGVITWVHPRRRFALVIYRCGCAGLRGAFQAEDLRKASA